MGVYEICATILVSGITAHIVECYEIAKIEKLVEKSMNEYAKKIQEIVKRKF